MTWAGGHVPTKQAVQSQAPPLAKVLFVPTCVVESRDSASYTAARHVRARCSSPVPPVRSNQRTATIDPAVAADRISFSEGREEFGPHVCLSARHCSVFKSICLQGDCLVEGLKLAKLIDGGGASIIVQLGSQSRRAIT